MMYDVVVIGGGIAGLYTTYQILRKSPSMRVLLLEKRHDLGGRVYTSHDFPGTPVETGAGRFSDQHQRLWALLRKLRLDTHAVELPAGGQYIDATGKVSPGYEADVADVVAASRKVSREVLQTISFLDYARSVVGKKRAQHIVDSFGYYSELVVMNAHDAIVLMGVLDTHQTRFYSLAGGLSQIIDRLADHIRRHSRARVLTGHTVVSVRSVGSEKTRKLRSNGGTRRRRRSVDSMQRYCVETEIGNGGVHRFWARQCVFAVPKQALERLAEPALERLAEPALERLDIMRPLLRHIRCGSLCRIYAKFAPSQWLASLVKTTTNNDLRMVIPIDPKEGIVMASYTDNRFADRWRRLEKTKGIDAVRLRLKRLLKKTFPTAKEDDLDIQDVRVFYWPCGVGYWGVGANSADIARRLVQPLSGKRIYVCGEHFSETNQQWMEGALETSEEVVRRVLMAGVIGLPAGPTSRRESDNSGR